MIGLGTLTTIATAAGAIVTISGLLACIFRLPSKWIKRDLDDYINERVSDKMREGHQAMDARFDKLEEMITGLAENQKKIAEDNKKNNSATIADLRHSITDIYDRYLPEKCLPANTKKDLCSLYEVYEGLGGNSYVHEIFEDMMDWDVK